MSDPKAIEQARMAVEQILGSLGVARVVCVDDTYGDEPSVEAVIVAAVHLAADRLRELLPELGEIIPDDQDVLKQRVRNVWRALENTTRRERTENILTAARLQESTGTNDPGDASILSELIPEDKLITLSVKQWKARSDELVKKDSDLRTLFLFDQDLSDDGGDVDGGIKIIASLLAGDATGGLICGLLTHTVTPENQPERWSELSQTHNIPRDRFIVVPKQYLSKDPVFFAQLLKLVALSPDFSCLKEKTKKLIADAAAVAAGNVGDISIYDLDHIVFRASAEEGLWEPDMLLRLHSLFHQLEARRLAHEGGELEAIARRLRSVSHIPTEARFHPPSSTWAIQRKELYESAEHLGRNHLPLELGDIFARTSTSARKRYILLAQPCDLMVRTDGKRHPELVHVPLAEVVPAETPSEHYEELAFFSDRPGDRWFVRLKRIHLVRVCILDLCVFDDEGKAVIQPTKSVPEWIRPAWRARYGALSKAFGRLMGQLKLLSPVEGESSEVKNTKDGLGKVGLFGDLLDEGLFKGEAVWNGGEPFIKYNCCRIGRLSRARAFGLLMGYTSCLSRPAYDLDFGGTAAKASHEVESPATQ